MNFAETRPLQTPAITVAGLRTTAVALVFLASFVSRFQPAPCDYFFVLAVLLSLVGGLRMTTALVPLLVLLLIYNIAGLISWTALPEDTLESQQYLLGLAYTSFSGFFFAAYIMEDPVKRYQQIMKAYWVGATIGAIFGLIGYFKLGPLGVIVGDYAGRAVGFYKDPNVFSTWLVPPMVTMLQAFVLGTLRLRPLAILSFLLIFAALFLAFSRGAWINGLMSVAITIIFTFALSPTTALRSRILISGIAGIVFLALVLVVLLSIPETRDLFLDRFTLVKSYDAGEMGRFGNQVNSVPMLVERPWGFGPYQFGLIFGEAPHNTFLNSFSSAGWLGGIAYIVFVFSTIFVGLRTLLMRTPFQTFSIAAFACYVSVAFQGVQIDTEHWRHMYWMVAMVWGFFGASFAYQFAPLRAAEILAAWNAKSSSNLVGSAIQGRPGRTAHARG